MNQGEVGIEEVQENSPLFRIGKSGRHTGKVATILKFPCETPGRPSSVNMETP